MAETVCDEQNAKLVDSVNLNSCKKADPFGSASLSAESEHFQKVTIVPPLVFSNLVLRG